MGPHNCCACPEGSRLRLWIPCPRLCLPQLPRKGHNIFIGNLRSKAEGDPKDILTSWTYINSPICVLVLDTCAEGRVLVEGLLSYWEGEEGPLRAQGD